MRRNIRSLLFVFYAIAISFLYACNERDDYYGRPEWLEPPIYDQLEEKGNFSNYLALVDQTGYKNTLSGAGYYTVFAPTDEAFQAYFQKEGISALSDIDSTIAEGIIKYSIIYNAYFKDDIDNYQNSGLDTTDRYDQAFRRRTTYYKWVYEEEVEGQNVKVVDQNGVQVLPEQGPYFSSTDNNNKYIPFITDGYMASKNLSEYDYAYFFPEKSFTGFNVYNAEVIESDLRAENGVIHIVDEVIPPLPNIEDLLTSNEEYSVFYELIEKYSLEYDLAPEAFLDRYSEFNGSSEDVYIKQYDLLNFAPNCENYMKYGGGATHDAQKDSWTMFVPNNAATNDFINSKLLQHYSSIDNLSNDLIAEFINAHLFRTTVWPSKFEQSVNYYGEPARFDPENNIIEKSITSNGLFYGTNIIQKTDAFYTVLGEIILNPDYALMVAALKQTNVYDILKNPKLELTVFLLDNDAFYDLGLEYDGATNSWELNNPDLGSNATLAVSRIIKMNMVLGSTINDFSGDGLIETYGGEYVRYLGGQLFGAGNYQDAAIAYPRKPNSDGSNGITYEVNKPLYYSTQEIGYDIEQNQGSFSEFFRYLDKAGSSLPGFVYDPTTKIISSINSGEPNTLLIPTDTAMQRAVLDGYLPVITAANLTQPQLEQVQKFINYHCINGQIVVPNSDFTGTVRTLFQTDDGPTFLEVQSLENNLEILDHYNRDVHLIYATSNILSNNAVIHTLDNYLKYIK